MNEKELFQKLDKISPLPSDAELLTLSAANHVARAWGIIEGIPLDELETLCKAYKDGRAVVLPCKVGDTVFRIYNTRGCENCINLQSSCDGISCPKPKVSEIKFAYDDMNTLQDIKLTREEAEKALEGMK